MPHFSESYTFENPEGPDEVSSETFVFQLEEIFPGEVVPPVARDGGLSLAVLHGIETAPAG